MVQLNVAFALLRFSAQVGSGAGAQGWGGALREGRPREPGRAMLCSERAVRVGLSRAADATEKRGCI